MKIKSFVNSILHINRMEHDVVRFLLGWYSHCPQTFLYHPIRKNTMQYNILVNFFPTTFNIFQSSIKFAYIFVFFKHYFDWIDLCIRELAIAFVESFFDKKIFFAP